MSLARRAALLVPLTAVLVGAFLVNDAHRGVAGAEVRWRNPRIS